jgi:hypothetical protein
MRAPILKLKKLREIRRDSRQRDFVVARQALAESERALSNLQQARQRLEHSIVAQIEALAQDGRVVSSGDFATMERAIKAGRVELERIGMRIARARTAREAAAATLREASRKLRVSEQSLEQIGQLDARLAEEELRAFEQQEEAEAERIGQPKRPGSVR